MHNQQKVVSTTCHWC